MKTIMIKLSRSTTKKSVNKDEEKKGFLNRGERWKSEVGFKLSPHMYKTVKELNMKPKSLIWWCNYLNTALSNHRVSWISVLMANVIYRASSS